jgi:hypothetical protein
MEERRMPFVVRKMTKNKMARYSRHLKIPEIGEAGQLKLMQARFCWSAPEGWVRQLGFILRLRYRHHRYY